MLQDQIEREKLGYPWHNSTKQLISGISYSKKTEILPFEFYNRTHVMTTYMSANMEPSILLIGRKKSNFEDMLSFVEKSLATDQKRVRFINALRRTIPALGEVYEVLVGLPTSKERHPLDVRSRSKVTVVRPFKSLTLVQSATVSELLPIDIVLSVNGSQIYTLPRFFNELLKAARADGALSLTVFYSGGENVSAISQMLRSGSILVRVVRTSDGTSDGVDSLRKAFQNRDRNGDSLLFFTDVDLIMKEKTFVRCRYHAVKGRSVYYPIPFGLYNPYFIYPLVYKMKIPKFETRLLIKESHGRWQLGFYGASCQYLSDFMKMTDGGHGLGTGPKKNPDELLFQKYLRSTYTVYRVYDPDIFHLYQPRRCATLPDQLFWTCILNKIHYTGPHVNMPLLIH